LSPSPAESSATASRLASVTIAIRRGDHHKIGSRERSDLAVKCEPRAGSAAAFGAGMNGDVREVLPIAAAAGCQTRKKAPLSDPSPNFADIPDHGSSAVLKSEDSDKIGSREDL
jgi:hypothetical protein